MIKTTTEKSVVSIAPITPEEVISYNKASDIAMATIAKEDLLRAALRAHQEQFKRDTELLISRAKAIAGPRTVPTSELEEKIAATFEGIKATHEDIATSLSKTHEEKGNELAHQKEMSEKLKIKELEDLNEIERLRRLLASIK